MSRINKIPQTYTYDDFERMANRKPSLEGDWIYRLTQTFYDPDIENLYPKFKLDYDTHRLFLSFEEAQKFLKENSDECVYCNRISQVPIGGRETDHAAEWLFDNEGNLLDYATTHTYGSGPEMSFFGRPQNRQRFKKGDIVEMRWRDEVSLAVLYSGVPDIDWCWGIYQRGLQRFPDMPYGLDFSDEWVIVIDGPSYCDHRHIDPLNVMKPRFPIPEDIRKELETWYESVKKENSPS